MISFSSQGPKMSKLMMITMIIGITTIISLTKPSEASSPPLAEQCSTAIQQLIGCLNFAKGGASEPTKECCTSVSGMKEKQPVCLCFFIGQAHNGSQQIKSLGIQEAKLLQLPSACHLTNASVSDCPKLLGISASSPAAAIFTDKNTTSSSSSSDLTGPDSSSGGKLNPENGVLSIFFAVFISATLYALSTTTTTLM